MAPPRPIKATNCGTAATEPERRGSVVRAVPDGSNVG